MVTILIELDNRLEDNLRFLLLVLDQDDLLLLSSSWARLVDDRVLDLEAHQKIVLYQTGLLRLATVDVLKSATRYFILLKSQRFHWAWVFLHLNYLLFECSYNRFQFFVFLIFICNLYLIYFFLYYLYFILIIDKILLHKTCYLGILFMLFL